MKRTLLLCLFLMFTAAGLKAQDSLWIKQKDGKPYLLHKVKSGETLFLLSKKYAVPPAVLADANHVNYQQGLPSGSTFLIPIDDYNFLKAENPGKSIPIYYRAVEGDDLVSISRIMRVAQSRVQWWNNMGSPDIAAGDVLQVGWVSYDKAQVPFGDSKPKKEAATTSPVQKNTPPAKNTGQSGTKKQAATIPPPDLIPEESDTTVSAFEELYNQQTNGVSLNEESGAAVFYPLKTKAIPGVYYAFHNTALRGSILKITNPANGKIIYAKVIGALPNIKEYHNAVVGLSNNVIPAVEARDRRMFCKIMYR